MKDDSKEKIITNSLLFFLLRDSVPTADYDYEDFHRDKELIIENIKSKTKEKNLTIDEMYNEKEKDDLSLLKGLILHHLTYEFKKIIREKYYSFFRTSIPQKLRKEIFDRDQYKCQYCGADLKEIEEDGFPPQIDHIKSKRAGGKNIPENLLACCWKCNIGKLDYDIFEYEAEKGET